MQILDMEHKTGLDRATIRFYEKENLVVPVREENGYRVYSEEDLQLLLKIKLLRQLGVPLFKIKELQQGSGNFSVVLQEQIASLEKRIQDDTRAKMVCIEMQRAGAEYGNLDAKYYLEMLQTPIGQSLRAYQEPINKESHPFRRWMARTLDVSLLATLITFLIVVVFRIRPISDTFITIIGLLSYVAIIPVEACLLHFWGTTPGKWVMGIRLEHANGGTLSYNDAFIRGMYIIKYGYGFFIPIWEIWRLYKSYSDDSDNPWNEETEIIYEDWTVLRKVFIAVLLVVNIVLSVTCGLDAVLPRFRGDLTMQEFVKNYNSYEKMFGYEDNYYSMKSDGTWQTGFQGGTIIITDASDHERKEFSYNYEDGNLSGIHFEDTWDDPNFMDALPYYCRCAIFAFAGSRPGCTYEELIRLEGEIESNLYGMFAKAPESDSDSITGTIYIADVQITWNAHYTGISFVHDGMLYSNEDANSEYSLVLDMQTVK